MKQIKNFQFPPDYQVAILNEPNAPLKIARKEFCALQKGEVWIKIKASPINPSDLAMLSGTYPHKKSLPFVPGLEGSGLVVASGGGFMADFLVGKRVACTAPDDADGTWAQFMKTSASKCIPLNKALSFEQGASVIVNPMTALALIDRVKKSPSVSFVNTAAAGALGKMMIRLAKHENLTPINIVRRPEQVSDLTANGAGIVLDSSQPNFASELQSACRRHQTKIILDAVGGEFSNVLLENAPNHTVLIAYASLEKDLMHINPAPIIRFGKTIEGFHLAHWSGQQSKFKLIATTRKAQKLVANGTLSSTIYNSTSLSEINNSIEMYRGNMSAGKWLLSF